MTVTEPTQDATEVEMVNLTIDDVPISVPKGTLVIRAAELMGVRVPRFCDHPLLDPVGACRQCLVEVEGQRKPMASCTITCTPDMVVRTQFTSEAADKAQHGVMELLLINHPLDCPVCDKGGECPLQNQAMSNGRVETRSKTSNARSPNRSRSRPRCSWTGNAACCARDAPGSPSRSRATRSSNCWSAVRCSRSASRRMSRSRRTSPATPCRSARWALDQHRLSVPGSTVRPGLQPQRLRTLRVGMRTAPDHRRGKVLRRLAGDDPEVNEEWNCDKGRWAFTYATVGDRIATPQIREEDGKLRARVVVGGAPGGRSRPGRRGGTCRRACGWPQHRRGRLRILEIRPDSVGHQRHRLPDPPAQRRGNGVPGGRMSPAIR